jgi:SAM-dependent methyltransferase
MRTTHVVVLAVLAYFALKLYNRLANLNPLETFDENTTLGHLGIQAALFGFCLNTNALANLLAKDDKANNFDMHQADMGGDTDFSNDGNIDEDKYAKQSIYSVLYSIYADLDLLQHRGERYQFRFNTWGVTGVWNTTLCPPGDNTAEGCEKNGNPSMSVGDTHNNLVAYPETQPQKAGKTAYASLLNFKSVREYLKKLRARPDHKRVKLVEIGSGTGAGANELTWLHHDLDYTAVEMQKPGWELCKKIHEKERLVAPMPGVNDKPKPNGKFEELLAWDHRLKCIQANGQFLHDVIPDASADIVLISETHIADVLPVDAESKKVFDSVARILKPGGVFVWGNAIPTSIVHGAIQYLQNDLKMKRLEIHDVTDNAVQARDDDYSRAIDFFRQGKEVYLGLSIFPQCSWMINRLIMNFYRQPGTALYKRMLKFSNKSTYDPAELAPCPEGAKTCANWCEELDTPRSFCQDRRIDTYFHMAYMKPSEN